MTSSQQQQQQEQEQQQQQQQQQQQEQEQELGRWQSSGGLCISGKSNLCHG